MNSQETGQWEIQRRALERGRALPAGLVVAKYLLAMQNRGELQPGAAVKVLNVALNRLENGRDAGNYQPTAWRGLPRPGGPNAALAHALAYLETDLGKNSPAARRG
jgi:hypothetical protein